MLYLDIFLVRRKLLLWFNSIQLINNSIYQFFFINLHIHLTSRILYWIHRNKVVKSKSLNLISQGALNFTHRTQWYHVCTSLLGISKSSLSAWTYQKIWSTKGCNFDGGQTSGASRVCNQVGSRKLSRDGIKSNAETYIVLRLIYAKVLKEEVSQLQAIDLLLDSP